MKIVTVVGARPQFVKAAVVTRAIRSLAPQAHHILVHTGQHYDANMSQVFFDELDIPIPDHSLGIGGGSHGQNTGRMLEAVERVLSAESPNWVVVYGDTDSTLAAALAAAKLHLPVAHVEAGLRSFNKRMPEEINRIVTDHVSDLLFAPTEAALENLVRESIDSSSVRQSGDVMYDASLYYRAKAETASRILDDLSLTPKSYVLATVHREENVDRCTNLEAILCGLGESEARIVMPLHPRTKTRIAEFGIPVPQNILLIPPVGYLAMALLEHHASLIVTDSGGVQKEAYFHGVPCLTLRSETEWVELITAGANRLVNLVAVEICAAIRSAPIFPISVPQLYGNGHAGVAIAEALLE